MYGNGNIIIIIIIIIIISFMQGTYIPETNYVPTEHGVAAILLFLFMVLISLLSALNLLYFYINTFPSMCAVPNMALYYYYYYIHLIHGLWIYRHLQFFIFIYKESKFGDNV